MLDLCTDSGFLPGVKLVMKHVGPLLVSITVYMNCTISPAVTLHSALSFFNCKPCTATACELQIVVRAVESEQTKLDQVFKLLGYLYQHFMQVDDDKVTRVMQQGLETRSL